mmetsp:Transcript_76810/g.215909  ORF Transcript_76810/g.215909 Transcript_76810/m.215909 type:complete len:575 (+) Transcript_76810:715-2439(+)
MRRHEDGTSLRQGRQADSVAHVVAEDREGRTIRHQARLVQRDGVAHCTHAELADTEAEVAALVGLLQEVARALHQRHVRGREVCRATHELRHHRCQRIQAVLRPETGGLALVIGRALRQGVHPALRQLLVDRDALELLRELRLLLLVLGPERIPSHLFLGALGGMGPEHVVDTLGHLELAVLPTELVASQLRLILAEGRTVGIVAVGLVRRAVADDGLDLDQRRLVLASLGLLDRLPDGVHIRVAVSHGEHLPAVGLVALAHILGEGQVRVAIDGDAVVVVEGDELAQAQVTGVRARLVGDALLHAAVAHDAVGVVVDQVHARFVVDRREVRLGSRKTDGIGDAHAKRAGRDFDACRLEVLRVARRLGAPLPELLDVVHAHTGIAREVQHGVLQHAAVARGQHEAVAIDPLRVRRVEVHLFGEEHIADGGLSHGGTRVSAVRLVHGVHRQEADGVHALCVHRCRHRRGAARDARPLAAGVSTSGRSGHCHASRTRHKAATRCRKGGIRDGRRSLHLLLLDHTRQGTRVHGGAHKIADCREAHRSQRGRRTSRKQCSALLTIAPLLHGRHRAARH